jgi:hypothetical protein
MPIRRLPVGRITVAVAAAIAIWALAQGAGPVRWRSLQPGLEFATLRGEPYCRTGSPAIGVLRVDPARHRIRVHHYTRETPGQGPPGILEWQRRLGSLAVFNAGQYYPGYGYMGMLVSGGEVVSRKPHPEFQAALVAGRDGSRTRARVLDLAREPVDLGRREWDDVAQSFMLFDRQGGVRVRKSDRFANRTVVGEDGSGRLLVITTEGAYTLHDIATLLRGAKLGLTHAMSMDGGLEAEMCVAVGGFRWASFGAWPRDGEPEVPGARAPLPAVVEITAPGPDARSAPVAP